MAQTNSWVKQQKTISISVHDLIDLNREALNLQEQESRVNTLYHERMAWLEKACAEEEERFARRRAKIKATLERKKSEQIKQNNSENKKCGLTSTQNNSTANLKPCDFAM